MKIVVITLTKNEKVILPFLLRHYERFADEIVVFDNQSTDGTRDIIKAHPKTRLADYDTGGLLFDEVHRTIKNEVYRNVGEYALTPPLKADWFVIVDADEFLAHAFQGDIRAYLEWCLGRGITMPWVAGVDMFGDGVPEDDGKTPLTDIIKLGVDYPGGWKQCVVHHTVNANYLAGAHVCEPTGPVMKSPTTELLLLHYRWLSRDYALGRMLRAAEQLSEDNRTKGYGLHVLEIDKMLAIHDRQFKDRCQIIP